MSRSNGKSPEAAAEAFIRAQTTIEQAPLIPELRLHLARAVKPLRAAAEEELPDFDVDKPYWAFAWTSGLALARYILDHPQIVEGRRVMDFGCGAGQAAIAAKQAGAAEVVAVDRDPLACIATGLNAALNGVELTIRHGDPVADPPGEFDVLLAGDMISETELVLRHMPFFLFQAAAGCDVIFADPNRDDFPELSAEPLITLSVENDFEPNVADVKSATVFRIPLLEMEVKEADAPPPEGMAPGVMEIALPEAAMAAQAHEESRRGDGEMTPTVANRLVLSCTREVDHPLVPGLRLRAASNVARLGQYLELAFGGDRSSEHLYWAFPWASGQALAKLVHDEPERVRGKRVLDFACGSGQAAIAAALSGAASVEASDKDIIARAAARLNAELNGVAVTVTADDFVGYTDDRWDLVLVGDIYYSYELAAQATAWLKALAAQGVEVIVADNKRPHFPKAEFELIAEMTIEPYFAIIDADGGDVGLWRAKQA